MFEGEVSQIIQDDGVIYLDRNGKVFEAMINYLRDDRKTLPKFSEFNDQL